ncbi:hypothetical protein PUN28_001368 [Cardiocondyla obscurior]|uniref:Uncharacterized protein n=1 Tax=Cardiocondyla obscurior TaxID=286306 RepID=A0AAW2H4P7_9HYME
MEIRDIDDGREKWTFSLPRGRNKIRQRFLRGSFWMKGNRRDVETRKRGSPGSGYIITFFFFSQHNYYWLTTRQKS